MGEPRPDIGVPQPLSQEIAQAAHTLKEAALARLPEGTTEHIEGRVMNGVKVQPDYDYREVVLEAPDSMRVYKVNHNNGAGSLLIIDTVQLDEAGNYIARLSRVSLPKDTDERLAERFSGKHPGELGYDELKKITEDLDPEKSTAVGADRYQQVIQQKSASPRE